ncbi:LRR receptor-like serine/threonine-protein kinase RGI2 [Triticum aestivum]|uniref:non-specific serine/threonine protein kinase n=1 Tax=Triticum aestivum TaxID=4565 RepID=A0A3B6H482_WHEAT|nr:LRR receptor-like serine/threonine-protein kinase RGI2 [Triticum aestivum]
MRHLILLLLAIFFAPTSSTISSPNQQAQAAFLVTSWLNNTATRPTDWLLGLASPCGWSHISCDAASGTTVVSIIFSDIQLGVVLPRGLCAALPQLSTFIVTGAGLTGFIPDDLSRCSHLTVLDMSNNSLSGSIPSSLGNLAPSLKQLHLFSNLLSGELPVSLSELWLVESLRIGDNPELSGQIPESFSKLRNVITLGMAQTNISGSIPASLGQLCRIQTLRLQVARLSGSIPPELGNCSNLIDIHLYENSLSGPLPAALGMLPRLHFLYLSDNFHTGPIPKSFGNLTTLLELDLGDNCLSGVGPVFLGRLLALRWLDLSINNLTGSIPPEIGRLTSLTYLMMCQNQLSGTIPASLTSLITLEFLDLSMNLLTGVVPPMLFHLPNLTSLLLRSNDLSGPLPHDISRARNLTYLHLGGNRIAGSIPPAVAGMKSIKYLILSNNRLTGPMPAKLGSCLQLQMIVLSNNMLSGTLPTSLVGLRDLQQLDISHNQFTGHVPHMLSQLKALKRLMLSGNSFVGPIPASLGQCTNLELLDLSDNKLYGLIPDELFDIDKLNIVLNLSANKLTGQLPAKMSALKKLNVLDLSHNALNGTLDPLAGMASLVTLNVSNNNFSGYIPETILFQHIPISCLIGNSGLCNKGWNVCSAKDTDGSPQTKKNANQKHNITIIFVVIAAVLAVPGIIVTLSVCGRGKYRAGDSMVSLELASLPKFVAFQNLTFSIEQLLSKLAESDKIGQGAAAEVYRVNISNNRSVAVKKLRQGQGKPNEGNNNILGHPIQNTFWTEVRTIGSIRHKNIVRFLGYYFSSSVQLLLYDYVPNGSLGGLLHDGSSLQLDWKIRYQILLGVSHGLTYLHHDCTPPIIHRDIKPNNILIDLDFKAYIADFGIAKLFDPRALIHTCAGTFGYMAPEYTHGTEINEKSDVYSFGVVMLEVLTGKKPIISVEDATHIVEWVQEQNDVREALDSILRGQPNSEIQEMLQVIGVALLCTRHTPSRRPTMKDVTCMLEEIHGQGAH